MVQEMWILFLCVCPELLFPEEGNYSDLNFLAEIVRNGVKDQGRLE
jgi:hypothetical protein